MTDTRATSNLAGRRIQNGIWEMSAMFSNSENLVVGLSLVVQLIGIGGVFAARLQSTRSPGRQYDVLAFICFATVGILSLLLMRACTGCWLAFATTMPLMAVGATLDFGKRRNVRYTWDI
jgi:hypothetical protein